MAKLKKLSQTDLVKVLIAAEAGQLTADQVLDRLTDINDEEWVSILREATDDKALSQTAWQSIKGERIQLDDPRAKTLKNKRVIVIKRGDRHNYVEGTHTGVIPLTSTGFPFANRETDVDLGDHATPIVSDKPEPIEDKPQPRKKTETPNLIGPPKQTSDGWGIDFFGGSSSPGLGERALDSLMNRD